MKTLAFLLLVVGYVGLYQIANGNTHIIPMVLIAFGIAFIMGLNVSRNEAKKK